MKKLLSIGAAALVAAYSPSASAEFALSEMIVDIDADSPRQRDIEVVSQDKEVQYIAMETVVVENPGLPNEKQTPVTDPQKSGLMITPNKMALPAGARKTIRLLLLQPKGDSDKIYRVIVKPVVQGLEETKKAMALKVLVGYEALIIDRANEGKIDLVAQRKGNSLTITNKGTTNASLDSGEQCDATGGNCKDLNITRIYAGQSWTTTLPYMNGVATYKVFDGKEKKDLTF